MNLVQILGLVLVVLVACDAAVTVLHPDAEGLLATSIRRVLWRMTALLSTRLPRFDRHVLGLAGPVIVVLTFVSWIVLITLGVAVVVWPMLGEAFEVRGALGSPTFLDAFYFAAGTVSVLGYGDITPVSIGGQLISVFGAAIGFTMFSGMATYAIAVVSGVATRNRFTLAVHDDTRGGGGVSMIAECLAEAGADETRERCRSWAEHLRAVDEMVHRYPLVAFTYRSHRGDYDPEPALRHVGEATVTVLVAAGREPGLRMTAEALCSALTRLQCTIAGTYLGGGMAGRLADPEPTRADHEAVSAVGRVLSARLGPPSVSVDHARAAATVHRCRTFLNGPHRWSRTTTPPHEWDE
jgi:hypothetical protein